METNHLSECIFFQRKKRNIPFYILIDNGEGVDLRLSDLNEDGFCVVDSIKGLAAIITKRASKDDFKEQTALRKSLHNQKEEPKLKAIKESLIDRLYYPTPEQAYQGAKDRTIDYEELNLLYNEFNVLL